MEWDKDDDDALDFATSAANLRASIFSIPLKTRFDVKQMAGNIIPAIATTNAVIAGALIMQALHALRGSWTKARSVWFSQNRLAALNPGALNEPNPACPTCRTPYVHLHLDPARLTLDMFVEDIVRGRLQVDWDVSILDGSRIIYDPDFEDNLQKTFTTLNIGQGSQLQLNDEEGNRMPVVFMLTESAHTPLSYTMCTDAPDRLQGATAGGKPYRVDGIPATIPEQYVAPIAALASVRESRKRTASNAELDAPDFKKIKTDATGTVLLDEDEDDDDDLVLL